MLDFNPSHADTTRYKGVNVNIESYLCVGNTFAEAYENLSINYNYMVEVASKNTMILKQLSDAYTTMSDTELLKLLHTIFTDGATDGTPDGATDGTPDGATDGTPDGATDGTPDGATDGTPDGATDGTPDGATDVADVDTPASLAFPHEELDSTNSDVYGDLWINQKYSEVSLSPIEEDTKLAFFKLANRFSTVLVGSMYSSEYVDDIKSLLVINNISEIRNAIHAAAQMSMVSPTFLDDFYDADDDVDDDDADDDDADDYDTDDEDF